MELSKILKDEAWLEAEKRGEFVPLTDEKVIERSISIWEKQYEPKKREDVFLGGNDHCS